MTSNAFYRACCAPARLFVIAALLVCTGAAAAQTGPGLLIKTWDADEHVEIASTNMILGDGSARTAGVRSDADLRLYDLTARARLDPDDPRKLTVGFDYTYIDLGPSGSRLVDQSVAIGMGLFEADGWEVAATVGVGYAGNNPFADGNAWYTKASLIASHELDERSTLQFILDYNRNRAIFPDVPLPAIAYSRKSSQSLRYTVGLPFSSITWKPADDLTVDLAYNVPFDIDLTVTWQVLEQLAIFGGFHKRYDAFFIDGLPRERRHFFSQRSVEAGATWTPCPGVDLTVAAGYAFDQKIEVGFDARHTDRVTRFSDEPFIRLAADLRF